MSRIHRRTSESIGRQPVAPSVLDQGLNLKWLVFSCITLNYTTCTSRLKPKPIYLQECDAQDIFNKILSNRESVDIHSWRDEHAKLAEKFPKQHRECHRTLWKIVDLLEQRSQPYASAALTTEGIMLILDLMRDIWRFSSEQELSRPNAAHKLTSLLFSAAKQARSSHDLHTTYALLTEAVALRREILEQDNNGFGAENIFHLESALGRLYNVFPDSTLLRERIALTRQVLLTDPTRTRAIDHLSNLLFLLYDKVSSDEALYEAQALKAEYAAQQHLSQPCPVFDQMQTEFNQMYSLTDVELWVVQHTSLVHFSPSTHTACVGRFLSLTEDMENIFRAAKQEDLVMLARSAVSLVNRGVGISNQLRALNTLYQKLRSLESRSNNELVSLVFRINELVSGTKHRPPALLWLTSVSSLEKSTRPATRNQESDLSGFRASLAWDAIAQVESDTMPLLQWVNPELMKHNDRTKQPDTMEDFRDLLRRQAMQLGDVDAMPEKSPERAHALTLHAMTVLASNNPEHVDMVIGTLQESIRTWGLPRDQPVPPGHPMRQTLGGLAHALYMRHWWFGEAEDIESAVRVLKYAMAGAFHETDHMPLLGAFANALEAKYRRLGAIKDILDAAALSQLQLDKLPGHIEQLQTIGLRQLAKATDCLFDAAGRISLLDYAAGLARKALRPLPTNHPLMPSLLGLLGSMLRKRFLHLQMPNDLVVSEQLTRAAVQMQEDSDSVDQDLPKNRAFYAETMLIKFEQDPKPEYLDKALSLFRSIFDECSDKDAIRPDANYWYGSALCIRNQEDDIVTAIHYLRQCLLLQPDTRHTRYPIWASGLSVALLIEFRRTGKPATLDEAFKLAETASSLVSDTTTIRADIYAQLGETRYRLFKSRGLAEDLEACLLAFESAGSSKSSPRPRCVKFTRRWEDIAARHNHPSLWRALDASLAHQNKIAGVGLNAKTRHEYLAKNPTSASRAAAQAIRQGKLELAIEYLERGRLIMWRQTLELRSSLESLRLASPSLADQLAAVVEELDSNARVQSVSVYASTFWGVTDPDRILRYNRELAEQYDSLLEQIRELDGFSDFLRPFLYTDVAGIASEGPVIVLNLCDEGCDALVLLESGIHHVGLPRAEFEALSNMKSALAIAASRVMYDGGTEMDSMLPSVLRTLWSTIVEPIVALIQGSVSSSKRLFWCVAGLSDLPIHAAGPYRAGQRCLPDMFISSYTPTLSALIRSRKAKLNSSLTQPRILAVAQTETSGFTPLPFALAEISALRRLEIVSTELLDSEATCGAVLSQLQTHSWVHFSCHGTTNVKLPLLSAFHLADQRLNIESLMRTELPLADFAFLGACHSAEGSEAQNESMSLASALQVAGFRSIVATMYAIGDADGPIVAQELYGYLFRNGDQVANSSDAALGLNKATRALRLAKTPMHRWVSSNLTGYSIKPY